MLSLLPWLLSAFAFAAFAAFAFAFALATFAFATFAFAFAFAFFAFAFVACAFAFAFAAFAFVAFVAFAFAFAFDSAAFCSFNVFLLLCCICFFLFLHLFRSSCCLVASCELLAGFAACCYFLSKVFVSSIKEAPVPLNARHQKFYEGQQQYYVRAYQKIYEPKSPQLV